VCEICFFRLFVGIKNIMEVVVLGEDFGAWLIDERHLIPKLMNEVAGKLI